MCLVLQVLFMLKSNSRHLQVRKAMFFTRVHIGDSGLSIPHSPKQGEGQPQLWPFPLFCFQDFIGTTTPSIALLSFPLLRFLMRGLFS
jgi:hypothetical protein